jgi:hypothetical protein
VAFGDLIRIRFENRIKCPTNKNTAFYWAISIWLALNLLPNWGESVGLWNICLSWGVPHQLAKIVNVLYNLGTYP